MKNTHIAYVVLVINKDGGSKVKCVCQSSSEATRKVELFKAENDVFYAIWHAVPYYSELTPLEEELASSEEVRFMAVLKIETKRKAFFAYGGAFNYLRKSEAEVERDMAINCYLRSDYDIVKITKEEAKEFVSSVGRHS